MFKVAWENNLIGGGQPKEFRKVDKLLKRHTCAPTARKAGLARNVINGYHGTFGRQR